LNFIITSINTLIRGLNSIKVPDWVPILGGGNLHISEIPMLAKGSRNSPRDFIAGENGPELITNAPGRTVYTAKETQTFLKIIEQVRAFDLGSMFRGGVIPAIAGAGGPTYTGGYNTATGSSCEKVL
jgi:hypothetical protein